MKTEVAELEAALNKAVPETPFKGSLPEYFLAIGQSRAEYTAKLMETGASVEEASELALLVELESDGHICLNIVESGHPPQERMGPYVKMTICIARGCNTPQLFWGSFILN